MTLNARRLEIRDIFERLITALGNKDFDGVEALLTEDAVFDWPYLPLDTMAERMIGAKTFGSRSLK